MTARLGRVFWWLFAGTLLSALATFVVPFLAMYLTSRGLRPSRVGLVASCFGLGAFLAGPAAGVLADALGRRRTLAVALLAAAAAACVLAFARPPMAIAAGVLAFGAAMTATRPPMRAIVADVVPPGLVARAFGWIYWAENVGASVSLLVGGLLAAHGWALPFLVDGGTTLGFAALVLLRIPETRPAGAAPAGESVGYGVVLADRRLLALLGLVLLVSFAYMQSMVALAIDMASRGYSPATFGAVGAVSAALVVLLQPFSGRALEPLPAARSLFWGGLLIGLGVGAYAVCDSPWQFGAATALLTLGEIAFFATAATTVSALAPPHARGRYMAAYGLCLSLGSVASPAVGPAVLEGFGPRVLWPACLAVAVFAAAGFLAWGRTGAPGAGGRGSRLSLAHRTSAFRIRARASSRVARVHPKLSRRKPR